MTPWADRPPCSVRRLPLGVLAAVLLHAPSMAAERVLPAGIEALRDALWVEVEMIAFVQSDTGAAPDHRLEGVRLPNDAIARAVLPRAEPVHGCGHGPQPPELPMLLTPHGRPERPAWLKPIPHAECEGIGETSPAPRTHWPAIPTTVFGNPFHSAALHACFEDGRIPRFPAPAMASLEEDEETQARRDAREQAQRHYEGLREAGVARWSALQSLQGVRDRLASRFRVVGSGAWRQRTEPPRSATPMLVQLGANRADGRHEVEGTLKLTARPYPQVEVRLTRSLPGGQLALMQENRRLGESELHYLDHPAFGLLLEINEVEEPPELAAALEEFGYEPR